VNRTGSLAPQTGPPPLRPMLARLVHELPPADDYLFEPKWDGFRCLATRDGDDVELISRHGRPLGRYFPELTSALGALAAERFTLDGEILAAVGGRFDFEALMGRLHPAPSRVRRLAASTPALYVAFDLPAHNGHSLAESPFAERRRRLAQLLADAEPPIHLTPATTDRAVARRWLREFQGAGLDGVVAKHRDLRYQPGARAMLKVKHERTVECVVAGVRGTPDPPEVSSMLLGLYTDDGTLEHIGVASSFARAARRAFAEELRQMAGPLAGHPWEHGFLTGGGAMGRLKGAAGRWVPGMSLDWVPLRPELVAEVRVTQVDGHRLRHPARFVRWRPDRDPRSCHVEQLEYPPPPSADVLSYSRSS
jgi:ATP-dependent DNA ligase